ncbi:hypothetical protein [Microlunatus soli]|uniref:Integral membrane protein n=1 Tax=Microlunatus soli TaxID=630515 RepID=A0A1H1Y338_9ACTN|nr:hypothetical protein [Microlunatus soli]SDT15416.1 hypothetical protein SAMN04489812_4353 [Microlunatus soli]
MTSVSTPTTGPRSSAVFGVSRWLLRILLTLTALLLFTQPVSIGQYLQGRFTMLDMHAAVGSGVIVVSFFAACAAVFYTIVGGRVWVPITVGVTGFLIEIQVGMGYAHQLGIHVPLGVTIIAAGILLAIWVWTPASGRSRARRRPPIKTPDEVDRDPERVIG